jgi:hypothetical protein
MSIGRWIVLLLVDVPTARDGRRVKDGCAYQVKRFAVNSACLR